MAAASAFDDQRTVARATFAVIFFLAASKWIEAMHNLCQHYTSFSTYVKRSSKQVQQKKTAETVFHFFHRQLPSPLSRLSTASV